jgi:hypothetical protein
MSIYLAKTEDEYFFASGTTASTRLKQYLSDWGVPMNAIPETGTGLSRAIYRSECLANLINRDLTETACKGGNPYTTRMTPSGMSLVQLGANEVVWCVDSSTVTTTKALTETMDGVITQVKVLGKEDDAARSPTVGLFSGDTGKYGTIQKVIRNDQSNTHTSNSDVASQYLMSPTITYNLSCVDINTIYAGDAIVVDGENLIVERVTHEAGNPDKMQLTAMSMAMIRRKHYTRYGIESL